MTIDAPRRSAIALVALGGAIGAIQGKGECGVTLRMRSRRLSEAGG
jgi:hypothetical protein